MIADNRMDQIVAEFVSHDGAERAIQQLTKDGVKTANLTIVGSDYHTEEHPVGYVNTGDRMLAWGKSGAFWGSMWGILFGSAIVIVPGFGGVLMAGWLVSTLVSALEGAAIGGGIAAVTGALFSIGIPKDSVIAYESAIKAGKFLVIVRGTSDEIGHSMTTLRALGGEGLEVTEHRQLAKV